jgi:hypothetical protein
MRKLTNKMKMSSAEAEKLDKRNVAFHEAGHAIVAEHFGGSWAAHITRKGKPTLSNKSWTGQTHHLTTPTPFRRAVIGWAGMVAEEFFAQDAMQDFTLDDLRGQFEFESESASQSDRTHIDGTKFKFRALKTALRIILSKKSRLAEIAEVLMRDGHANGPKS